MIKSIISITLIFLFTGILNSQHTCAQSTKPPSNASFVIVSEILVTGNKTTKQQVILRELLLKNGDTIPKAQLDELIRKSKDNLFNTSLFNFINIKIIEEKFGYMRVLVMVEERWYLWPYPIFEHADRNFSAFLHEKDWTKINYGLYLVKNNFRGRRETFKVKARVGYKEQFQLFYDNPYLTKNKKHGMSVEFSWFQQHEIAYKTINDQLVYYKDEDKYIRQYFDSYLNYQFRKQHYTNHRFYLSFTKGNISDTIVSLNPNYFGRNNDNIHFLSLSYKLDHDKRNYKYYPLFGYNLGVIVSQKGLGLLKDEMSGITALEFEANKFFKLSEHWYSAIGGKARFSSTKKQPYFIQQALGYNNSLRSFEYNVIGGQHFFLGRSFIKYALVPMNVTHFESWSWNKFNKIHYSVFLNYFLDAGYVYNRFQAPQNSLPNTFLLSSGIGLDFVTYYDQIIRFEYSFNQLGQHGFFIHFGKAF